MVQLSRHWIAEPTVLKHNKHKRLFTDLSKHRINILTQNIISYY